MLIQLSLMMISLMDGTMKDMHNNVLITSKRSMIALV